MTELESVSVPTRHFGGLANVTPGNVSDPAVGDLATILNRAIADLNKVQLPMDEAAAKQCIVIDNAGGVTADVDYAIPAGYKIRVLDVKTILRGNGASGDLVQVKKKPTGSAVAISEALDVSGSTNDIVRAAVLTVANVELDGDAGDSLRLSVTDAGAGAPATTTVIEFVQVP